MLEKAKTFVAASKYRLAIVLALVVIHVTSGMLLGEMTYQQALEVFIRALGL